MEEEAEQEVGRMERFAARYSVLLERRSKKHLPPPRISSSLCLMDGDLKQEDTEEGDMLCRNWSR